MFETRFIRRTACTFVECEIVYHRRCGRKLVARERDGTRTVGVDDDARDVHSTAGQAVIDGLDDPGYAEATTTTTAPTKAFRRRIRVLVDDADVRFTYHAEDGHRVTNVPHTYVSGADPKNVPLEISNRLS